MLNESYCIADENRKTFERENSIEPYIHWDGEKYSPKPGHERWRSYANGMTQSFKLWLEGRYPQDSKSI